MSGALWLGRGYGYSTREGEHATAHASSLGLRLDPTYTAKSFAAALALAAESRRTESILFWHTLSSAPLEDAPPLPPDLERLFK